MAGDSFAQLLAVYKSGRAREAVRLAENYIRQNPMDERAYHLLAAISLKAQDFKTAERTIKAGLKATAKRPQASSLLWDISGQLAETQKHYSIAEKHYKKAVLYDKQQAVYPYHLGKFYEKRGNVEAARAAYGECLKRDPAYVAAQNDLGLLALDEEDFAGAEAHFEGVLASDENYQPAWQNLSHVKVQYPDAPEQAIKCAEQAVRLSPNREALMTLAQHCGALGQAEQAAQHYAQALELDDGHYAGHIWLAIARYSPDEKHITAIEKSAEKAEANSDIRQKALLYFAKAKICEHKKQYSQAESDYLEANTLWHNTLPQDNLQELRKLTQAIKAAFADVDLAPDRVIGRTALWQEDFRSVFITGTMRCGSSLLEQILACHSDIGGAGEVSHFAQAVQKHGGSLNDPQKLLAALSDDAAKEKIASAYGERLGYFFRDRKPTYITDKYLDNFLHIGWIRLLIPSAKIILCHRQAEDAALSIFCNYFAAASHRYAYDINDIAEFFALYEELTTFWRDKCGDSLYHLRYEDLVTEPQETVHDILRFLQLPPEDGMLDFATSKRAVQTASSAEVRSEIHKSSVNKIARFPKIQKLWQEAYKPFNP